MVTNHDRDATMTIAPADGSATTGGPDPSGPDSNGPDSNGPDKVPQPVVRSALRLRKARQRRRRATVVQTVLTVLFVVALLALGFVGWRSSLKLTGGRDLEVTDPAAAGYVAEVKPTSADLLAVTDADGGLATMLLVLGGPDSAATVVPISAWLTLWDFEDAGPGSARNLFAAGGIDTLRLRLGVDLTFGATDAVTVPGTVIEQLATKVGPVTVNLPDNVVVDDGAGGSVVKYPAGSLTLQPTEVMEFLSVQGIGEAELNRSLRLSLVWTALFDGLAAKGGSLDLPANSSEDLSLFGDVIDGLDESGVSMQLLPTNEIPLNLTPPKSIDQIDAQAMTSWVPKYVPFPTSAYPGQRATVNLLNGTPNKDATKTIAPKIVAGGGEISLTGNAESFDIVTSRVEYGTVDSKAAADAIAAQLGLTATEASTPSESVDVTVVVGKDLVP